MSTLAFKEFVESGKARRLLLGALRLIHERPGVTRAELGAELGLSKVGVKNNVEELLSLGFVREGEPLPSANGRRPVPLTLEPRLFYSLGCYVRAGRLALRLEDASGDALEEVGLGRPGEDAAETVATLAKLSGDVLFKYGVPISRVLGMGLCVPGILDLREGVAVSSPAFKLDRNYPLAAKLAAAVGVPCHLANDADLMAVAEKRWGEAKDMKSFLYLTCGYGLGMFLNNQLYNGHQGNAGEVGYMQLNEGGPRDIDGRAGTLYSIAPFYQIVSIVEDIIKKGGESKVRDFLPEGRTKVDFEMVLQAIEAGDGLCAQLVAERFEQIGRAVLNLAYLFNPEAIFLDDWTARCPGISLDIARRMLGHYGAHNWRLSTQVLPASQGRGALPRAAAALPLTRLFQQANQ